MDSPAVLHCCQEIDLLPLIIKIDANKVPLEIAPSSFMAEMKLSTEERLEKLRRMIKKPKPKSNISSNFDITPEVVIFQNFKKNCSYVAPLILRNAQSILKPLRAIFEPSPYFSVTYVSKGCCTNIAPGIAIQLNVKFCGEELKDYRYNIKFATEGEQFIVPIIAIGPRPLLDLPDNIVVPNIPVKMESTFTTLVRNFGEAPAVFTIDIDPPFFPNVTKGILEPHRDMQLVITFKPKKVARYKRNLILAYENGEKLIIQVKAASESSSILLEKGSMKFSKTFMGLTRERTIMITNNSKHAVNFDWKLYASAEIDKQSTDRCKNAFGFMKTQEIIKCNKLETFGIIEESAHSKIYDRIHKDQIDELDSCQFPYKNDTFEIIPMKGVIWPNSTFDFKIIFSPKSVATYNSSAYLEVTGREQRLKLILNGESIGPNIILNLTCLSANFIYMCSIHQYEVVAINKGNIPGEIMLIPTKPDFGSIITCHPLSLALNPDECGAFTVEFSSRQQGKFYENVRFEINHSKEIVNFTLEGEVVCPLLSLTITEIDFGVVPIGYPITEIFNLNNTSMVPIEFILDIHSDGCMPSITCEQLARQPSLFYPGCEPKEFKLTPFKGIVEANSVLSIEITLVANIVRRSFTMLSIKMWDSDDHVIDLPVKHNAKVPDVTCIPPQINIRFCFIRYPYKRSIILKNTTKIPGYFQIISKYPSREGGITCDSSIEEGSLKALGEIEVELTIQTNLLGEDKLPLFIQFFCDQPTSFCSVACKGQGPVVTIQPENIDLGKVKLLTTVAKNLTIFNESPIPAFVTTRISPKTLFNIEPRILELLPETSSDLVISLYLTNTVKLRDKLTIMVENGTDTSCVLKAKGYGTSILCQPLLEPQLNVGRILTHRKFTFPVIFTNMGNRFHKIVWSQNPNLKLGKEKPEDDIPSIFKIVPNSFDLAVKESIETSIEGDNKKAGLVDENFYCYALIEKAKGQKTILSFNVIATFVEPIVQLSKNKILLRRDIGPDNVFEFLVDSVSITNWSTVPIEIDLLLEDPFHIQINTDPEYASAIRVELDHLQTYTVTVEFKPLPDDKRCYVVEKTLIINYVNHPKREIIPLIGEVNYPNVVITPNTVNIPCVPTGASDSQDIIMKNISPLPVTYHFEWQEEWFNIENVSSPDVSIYTAQLDSNLSRISSASSTFLKNREMKKLEALKRQEEEELERNRSPKKQEKKDKKGKSPGSPKEKKGKKDSKKGSPKSPPSQEKGKGSKVQSRSDVGDIPDNLVALRTEYIYQRICVEKRESYHYHQIEDILYPDVFMKDAIFLPKRNVEYLSYAKSLIFGMIAHFHEDENDFEVIETVTKNLTKRTAVDLVLNVLPAHGFLKPFECQIISIGFNPLPKISTCAQLQCHVLGGASEFINISGMSSEIAFSINNTFIDFGRQVFCIKTQRSITLSNTGYADFEFLTSANEIPENNHTGLILEAGSLIVMPKGGVLSPGDSIQLQVSYLPGIAGEFNETFTIEIGYLPAVLVTVHGYGVFPQAYLYLPRPDFALISVRLTYLAIASLTIDYLKSLNAVKNIMHYNNRINYDEDIPKAARHHLKREGWFVVSHNDIFPSTMDIDLAIERIILYQNIYENPSILTSHIKFHKALMVPKFSIPPYLVDFGYVISETIVHYTILIFNYGPINTDIKLTPVTGKKNPFENAGIGLQFSRSIIPVGETKELFIIFQPTASLYPDIDSEIFFTFFLEVAHGPKIPINIKAMVTVPKIETDCSNLNFTELRCGDCRKRSILLHNNGYIVSDYRLEVTNSHSKSKKSNDIKDIFYIKTSNGVLEPGAKCLLDVYFQPKFAGNVEWSLVITIDQNPQRITVNLEGQGLMPIVKLHQDVLEFEPILPYAQNIEKIIKIENVSQFPIEVFLSDFDSEIDDEEKIINIVAQYYNVAEFHIPPRAAGEKLPQPLPDFYLKFMEYLRSRIIESERTEQQNFVTGGSISDSSPERRKSSTKKRSLAARTKSHLSTLKFSRQCLEVTDPLSLKTKEEIEGLILVYMEDFIHESICGRKGSQIALKDDPVKKAIMNAKPPTPKKEKNALRDGVFIIFHGGPFTSVEQSASKAGLDTDLPVYSVDRLFYESIIQSSSAATFKLGELVHTEFIRVASETDLVIPEWFDEYDDLEKEVDLLLSGKVAQPKSGKGSDKKEKGSEKKGKSSSAGSGKKGKGKPELPTLKGIPEELLCEVLQQKLATFETGIVIESLKSKFMNQPFMLLNNLLKAIGNARHIQFIVLSYTLENYIVHEAELKIIKEKEDKEAIERTLHKISRLPSDELDQLSPQEYIIFKEHLEKRKQVSLEKQEIVKIRLRERMEAKTKRKLGADPKKKTAKVAGEKAASTKSPSPKDKSLQKSTSSKGSSKGSKGKKGPVEQIPNKDKFVAFETEMRSILHLLENWDRKTTTCLKPFLPDKGGGKAKAPKSKPSKPSSKGTSKKGAEEPKPVEVVYAQLVDFSGLSPQQELNYLQTGVPVWLILNAHSGKPVDILIAYYLNHTPELQKSRDDLEESLIVKLVEEIENFTVLQRTEANRTKQVSNIFELKDAKFQSGYPSDISITGTLDENFGSKVSMQIRSKSDRAIRNSAINKRGSRIFSNQLCDSLECEDRLTTKMVLLPGEIFRYRVLFKPEECGIYEHTFTIEITGWPTKYLVSCSGKCDIPQIDMSPGNIFTQVANQRTKKNMYNNNLFLKELDVFDFGPVLLYDYDNKDALAIESMFKFKNASLLPCETVFSLFSDMESYDFRPAQITIPVDSEETFKIRALSVAAETTNNQLIISTKNNPKIEVICLTYCLIPFEVDVSPKKLSFERVPISRVEAKIVTIKNDSQVPIYWEFMQTESLYTHFNVMPLEGHLCPLTSEEIHFQFYSENVIDIPKQKLELSIFFGDCKCIAPLRIEIIEITGEAIEVEIDCDRELNLGEIKGKFEYHIPYEITNQSKYNVKFTLTEILQEQDFEFDKNKSLRSYFTFTPNNGILQCKKPFPVDIRFFARKLINFRRIPINNFIFTDAISGALIDNFALCTTGKIYFSSYEFCPTEELNFGYQMIGTKKMVEMSLKNIGKFEFKYNVLSQAELTKLKEGKNKKDKKGKDKKGKDTKGKDKKSSKSSTKDSKKDKSSKSSKASKGSKGKKKSPKEALPTTLLAGDFAITSSTGTLYPGCTVIIEIQSTPKSLGSIEEKIFFLISECRPAEKNGYPITLKVTSCFPSVKFDDYDLIFREQHVVNRKADFITPKEAEAHCIFIKEERRLHFSHVMINTEATARIRLQNNGPIPADISIKVISPSNGIFWADPIKVLIETYSTNYATISFVPNAISTFEGKLQIQYGAPGPYKFEVDLSGEGIVPEMVLEKPVFNINESCYTIAFHPTLVGKTSSRTISFKNVGIIPCQVIAEICESSVNSFALIPHCNTKPLLKVWEEVIATTAHTNIVNLKLAQKAEFQLEFKPIKMGDCSCLVKLHIINNPFETFMIFVTGEGYISDVTIEGLKTYSVKATESEIDFRYTSPGYELDFGHVFVNALQKKCFKISNLSKTEIYKFEFIIYKMVTFIPAVGHLKPGATKDVIVTFLSKEPVNISKEILECIIYKIVYIHPQIESLSWDERQNIVIWEPISSIMSEHSINSQATSYSASVTEPRSIEIDPDWTPSEAIIKTITEKNEPSIEVIPGTAVVFQISFSSVCNYSSYECSEICIKLDDTLIFEKKSYNFHVTNTSEVCLDLCWKISTSDLQLPARTNSATFSHDIIQDCDREFLRIRRVIGSANQTSSKDGGGKTRGLRPLELKGSEHFLEDESMPPTSRESLFSSESNLTFRPNSSTLERLPFTVTPRICSIKPNESQYFEVSFEPKTVFKYSVQVQSSIVNLHPAFKQINIPVRAKSLLPLCHFDLKPSNYLQNRRKGKKLCGDIADENTLVVHFDAIGLEISNVRTFNIINPNKECIFYKWIPSEVKDREIPLFHCHKPEGYIEKGKITEAIFSFLPQETGLFEAFYEFCIEKYDFSKTFLLVGNAREPNIAFSVPHVNMKPTVLGIDVTENVILKNNENFETKFIFKKDSLYSEARYQALVVEPIKGKVNPRGEQQIRIKFHPVKKGVANFTLKCVVDRTKNPISLPVTANCYDILSIVFYESDEGNKITLSSETINVLEMKSMVPLLKQNTSFTITNAGITGFYYSWSVKEDAVSERLKIDFNDKKGYVKSNTNAISVMSITPLTTIVITNLIIKLEIRYGPTYTLKIKGQASNTPFTFSFDEYNFGPTLVQTDATTYYKKVLDFINYDNIPVMLECKLPEQDFLSINLKSKQIDAKKSEPITLWFHPREIKRYQVEVQFYVNSKLRIVKILGEGVPQCIFLADPCNKFIDLGSITIGQASSKTIRVINDGLTPVDIIFDLRDRLPFFSRPKKSLIPEFERDDKPGIIQLDKPEEKKSADKKGKGKSKDSKKDKSKDSKKGKSKDSKKDSKKDKSSKKSKDSKKEKGKKGKEKRSGSPQSMDSEAKKAQEAEMIKIKEKNLIRNSLKFLPAKFVRVSSRQSMEFVIKFSPTERMKQFTENVCYQIQDTIQTLCSLRACSLASNYALDKEFITFGSTVLGYYGTQKVIVYNLGDVGGEFKWSFDKNSDQFTILPVQGFIPFNSSITFTITFKPTRTACLFESKLKCVLADFPKALELTLNGSCFDKPAPKDIIQFSCPVRTTDTKCIPLHNPTGETWTLTPAIKGQYFIAPEVFTLESRSLQQFEIIYKPLLMSANSIHEATIFFNIPEGKGLSYMLQGIAKRPQPEGTIARQINCKTNHTEVLTVKNWLKSPQRFRVVTETTISQSAATKPLYKLTGNESIDVLAQGERDYYWKIYVLNEGTLKLNVVFQNPTSLEYMYYEIALTVTKCPSLDVIKLKTCLRMPVSHSIKLQNPIKTSVIYMVKSSSPELTFDNCVTVDPYSEHILDVKYNPITLGESEAQLTITTSELGSYLYNFILTANPPVPEPHVTFSTNLGHSVAQKVFLYNPTLAKADFTAEYTHPEIFRLLKNVSASPHEKVEFTLNFEPNKIGTLQSSLTLTSPVTGTYIYPLIGKCNLPKPQGPYFVKPGESSIILFKNPFEDPQNFIFTCEPAIFFLQQQSLDILPKAEIQIMVSLVPFQNLTVLINQKYAITGKLIIYPSDPQLSSVKWIYYLQGDLANYNVYSYVVVFYILSGNEAEKLAQACKTSGQAEF